MQQNTAARYDSWLCWTALNFLLQQTAIQTSEARRRFRSQMQVGSCSCWCFYLFESYDGVGGRSGEEKSIILSKTYGLFPSYWQNDGKNVIKGLRPCHLCSTLPVKLFLTYHLSSILLIILLTIKVTVQILQVTVRDTQNCTMINHPLLHIINSISCKLQTNFVLL